MTTFADLLHKMAQNARLTPQELDELKRYGTETQQRNSFVAGNTSADNALAIRFPFFPIFTEILNVDTAAITVRIPGDYKHLVIFASGRTSTNDTSYNGILCSFNSDTGNNYLLQRIGLNNTTPNNVSGTAAGVVLSFFANAGNPSGEVGSSYSVIPHYNSSYYKNTFSQGGIYDASVPFMYANSDTWLNTSKVETLYIRSTSDNMSAGSAISIYGVF